MNYLFLAQLVLLALALWFAVGLAVVYFFLHGKTKRQLARYSRQQWLKIEFATWFTCVVLRRVFKDAGRCPVAF